ncbi:MAG: ABC-three component system middle component 5 [Desulfomicrobium sp.]
MIIYSEYKDIYHSAYRIISILNIINSEIEYNKLRIIDFFLVFPSLVNEISFPRQRGMSQLKNYASANFDTYEILPEKKQLFFEISPYQLQAVKILKAKGIINESDSTIYYNTDLKSESIDKLLHFSKYTSNNFYVKLIKTLFNIEYFGSDGLKKRSGLLEYKYDAI